MRSKRRLIAAFVVAALCAPGTLVRTELTKDVPESINLEQIAGQSATDTAGWKVAGVWQYSTGPSLRFGGFSALLPLSADRLRAFSDRGFVFTFSAPDNVAAQPDSREISDLRLIDPALSSTLWDIESATRDPAPDGDYWLGFEYTHAIHRFSHKTEPEGVRLLDGEVNWYVNGGLEAMTRLSDGRFLAIPERRSEALIYPSDPVEGSQPELIAFDNPADGYAVTDIAQIPDGRVLLLMRKVSWGLPPFESLIAIARPPVAGSTDPWSPQIALRLEGIIPRDNYEGIAVRAVDDGSVAVWIISDDNISVMQRTLLAKLVFDPSDSQN